jgi:nucleoside 2-deoxyribosyltransferase
MKIKIYLAGPLGFSEAGREFQNNSIIPILKKLGYSYYDPWKTKLDKKIQKVSSLDYGKRKKNEWYKLNFEIGKLNTSEIDSSDIVLAVLDGTDIDSGTAAEIGYAFAKGKKIIGYRGDFRLSADNEGSTVNLQVEYFIRSSGGTIIKTIKQLNTELKKLIKS